MDKNNVFRSSSFFMADADVLHVLMDQMSSDTLTLYLVGESDIVEYVYPLRECDIVLTTTKVGVVGLYIGGAGYVSVEWGAWKNDGIKTDLSYYDGLVLHLQHLKIQEVLEV